MKTFFPAVLMATLLCGCATVEMKVSMQGLTETSQAFVEDRTGPDNYPGFATGQGNIYSCRYGIHHQSKQEMEPPKAQMFAALLAASAPGIASHRVVLERFDVYHNARLRTLHAAGGQIGGGIGGAIASVGNVNKDVFVVDKLIVDANPSFDRHPKENQVGCNNAGEGEYYASEISGGHDVVVTWLKFSVDGKPYHFRTFYQFQLSPNENALTAVPNALRQTFQAIGPRLLIEQTSGP